MSYLPALQQWEVFLRVCAFFGDTYGNAETSRPVINFYIIKISFKKKKDD